MPDRVLVTHAVLHCSNGTSDKIWAGVVVAQPGAPAQTYTLYGRRGATLNVNTKAFPDHVAALKYFDQKMVEKLERHDYRRCHWQDRWFGVNHDLPNHFPELRPLYSWAWNWHGGPTTPLAYASLPRPDTAVAYPAGIYEVDQERRWWYVVPDDVPYGYATSPNALLVERGTRDHQCAEDDAEVLPTWVWRATKKSAALLAPKGRAWHPAEDRKLLERAQLELIASVLG